MNESLINAHIGSLEDMGRRFATAWKAAEAGREVARDHVTFVDLGSFMAAMSPRRLELMRHLRRAGPMSSAASRASSRAIINRSTARSRCWSSPA